MDIKVNQVQQPQQAEQVNQNRPVDDSFKFTLSSHIEEAELQARLNSLMDMRRYRGLIKDFMNEIVSRSHSFSRENFLDRRGRHRVYGIIRLVDETLDELAQELVKEESDNITILNKIGEIRGLLLDIFT